MFMYYFYVIKSELDDRLYFGYTSDLKNRIHQHNNGESRYTKKFKPWKLIYCEAYSNKSLAQKRERQIKQGGKVYTQLKKRLFPEKES